MITLLEKPYTTEELKKILHPLVSQWFFSKFKEFSLPQLYGVMEIHQRKNILISAPTGATKTLTAFLSILNELVDSAEKGILEDKIYCVYCSPLKALNNDIQKNLVEPLQEMEAFANKKLGLRVAVRTGDTSPKEKAAMLKNPPHILITTPESLAILLTSLKFVNFLRDVQWCIVDEIHALADNKRGVDLSLSLERLQRLSPSLCRIGLSATIAPLEEVAKFLVGYSNSQSRDCQVVDVRFLKKRDLQVLSPVKDLVNIDYMLKHKAMYELLHNLIQEHKTTLIFTNTRSGTERVVHNLKEMFPQYYKGNIAAHHGSLSKELRFNTEERLRKGEMKCIVCLDENSKILSETGEWIPIKDLKEKAVQSINKKLKINKNDILNRFKLKNKERLIRLKTDLGKEIICTKDHKFLTIDKKGNLKWEEAEQLKERESVATLRRYTYHELKGKELKKFIFENYPENYFITFEKSYLNNLRIKIKTEFGSLYDFWNSHLSRNLSYSTFLQDLRGNFLFKLKTFKKIINVLNLDSIEAFSSVSRISSTKYKMPKIEINQDLMRLIGFMLAEGYLTKRDLFVSNKNKELIKYYKKLIRKISGKNPWLKLGSTGTPILGWSSGFLGYFLRNLGFKWGRKARIVNIPSFIFRLNSKLIFSFLSGYFDGDGYLEIKKGKRVYAAGISTTSKEMAEDISRLLIREDIITSIRSRYYDEIRKLKGGREIVKKGWFYDVVVLGGENLRQFAEKITPIRKNLKRIKETLNLRGYTNLDVIPNLGDVLRAERGKAGLSTYRLQKLGLNPIKYELKTRDIGRKQLKRLLSIYNVENEFIENLSNSDLFWEKIKIKEEVANQKYVYNLEVENDHNYIANGFLTKNCSTSLELGIDIGYLDLVLCLGSPKSVARFLQRAGRAGHKLHDTVKARLVVMDRDDLVECSLLLKSALEKKIDEINIPKNCLDVLAQQIYGILIQERFLINDLFNLIKQSYCFHALEWRDFEEVLKYLSGEYVSLEDRYIFSKIWHDKETGMLGRRGKMARVIYMTNLGTIPDESFVLVKVGEQIVGKIDEGFLERLRPGDIFVLGGEVYAFKFARGMTAQVSASPNRPPNVPSWFSEMLPLSFDLAMEINKFRRLLEEKFKRKLTKKEVLEFICSYLYVSEEVAEEIYSYCYDQYKFVGLPSDKKILIEHFTDHDRKYVIFHTLFGRRVNDCLSRALAFALGRLQHRDVEIGISDNGFYLSANKSVNALQALKALKPEQLRKILEQAIEKSEVLARRFRHCAARSLMILREYKGKKKRVGRQQVSSRILMSAVRRISEDFPILKEARREVLEDLMDFEKTKMILEKVGAGEIKVEEVYTTLPSPFAFNLVVEGLSDIIKIEDKQEFLQRMHEMIKAKIALGKR